MTSKAASLAALVSAVVFGARAHAQSAPEAPDAPDAPEAHDAHGASDAHDGIRDDARQHESPADTETTEPYTQTPRLELSAGAGTEDARQLELRGSDRVGRLDVGLAGTLAERADRSDRSAALRLEHARGSRRARVFGVIDDMSLDLDAAATAGIRMIETGAGWTPGSLRLGQIAHDLVIGASYTALSGMTSDGGGDDIDDIAHMGVFQRQRRGDHRFFEAYLKDTLHVIETLDVSGGFVFDDWRSLSAIETIRYGTDEQMDVHAPSLDEMHFNPQLGAVYRATDHVALRASGYRTLRGPTAGALYAPLVLGGAVADANPQLHPESVWAGEVGPELRAAGLEARAVAFWHEIAAPVAIVAGEAGAIRTNLDHARVTGIESTASWRPTRPLVATLSYTISSSAIRDAAFAGRQLSLAPRHRASAEVAFEARRIATFSGGVRVLGRQYVDAGNTRAVPTTALVDAMAARTLTRGVAGYVSIENALDRRYVAAQDLPGAGRTVQIGVRLDSARF